jgi:hypothetical protein
VTYRIKTAAAKTVATQTSLGSAGLFMRILARAGSGLAGSDLGFDCGPASDRGRSRVSAKVADVVKMLPCNLFAKSKTTCASATDCSRCWIATRRTRCCYKDPSGSITVPHHTALDAHIPIVRLEACPVDVFLVELVKAYFPCLLIRNFFLGGRRLVGKTQRRCKRNG